MPVRSPNRTTERVHLKMADGGCALTSLSPCPAARQTVHRVLCYFHVQQHCRAVGSLKGKIKSRFKASARFSRLAAPPQVQGATKVMITSEEPSEKGQKHEPNADASTFAPQTPAAAAPPPPPPADEQPAAPPAPAQSDLGTVKDEEPVIAPSPAPVASVRIVVLQGQTHAVTVKNVI